MEIYQKKAEEVLEEADTSQQGLSTQEAASRLDKYGFNEIEDKEKVPTWKLFLETFKDPMVIVLLAAAAVQILIGEWVESIIIFLVLLINAVISVVQTRKAESSLEALQDMSAPDANVMRDGTEKTIAAKELVPGDIVYLEAGDYVPADGRLLESGSLRVNEGMLTGESEAVEKNIDVIEEEVALGDRLNMLYSSSLVVYGRGVFCCYWYRESNRSR